MTAARKGPASGQEYGLIVQEEGARQHVLARFLALILNYQYGLGIVGASDLLQAASLRLHYGQSIRCVCVVQAQKIEDKRLVTGLSWQGRIPLFLLVPTALVAQHQRLCARTENIFVCPWERTFSQSDAALPRVMATALEKNGVGTLLDDIEEAPHDVVCRRLERRLKHLHTLPTIPDIVLRIMRLVNDRRAATTALEGVLCRDAAIVWKLLQVVKSPVFAGTRQPDKWTLSEAVVRLGRRKVGAIAQQLAMINSLVKPEESRFDLRRFWQHSVGCAMIAEKLHTRHLISLPTTLAFNDYWIGALLHDIGKLVLGFFYWDWFEDLLNEMPSDHDSFRETEARLGGMVNHEHIGRLLLLHANIGPELAEVAGAHHDTTDAPGALVCLVHVANNLTKDLGLGYLPEERSRYSTSVLQALQLDPADLPRLQESLGETVVREIEEVVDRCLRP